ncbi:MAG: prepilin-type N-terminal cleavage/methylation domain-containing protein [Clostridia bacterium]|nr:prepilin-type N-terminal cleavage/methylation domain-containing protein [Clostridia bacterium]
MRFVTTMRKILCKNRKTNIKVNKKGFTLVELLVCVAIMAVIALLVAEFVASSSSAYRRMSSQTKVQEVCQDSLNQISNIVRNSKALKVTIDDSSGAITMESKNYEEKNIRLVYVPDTEENGFGRIYVDYDYILDSGVDITINADGENFNDFLLTDMVREFTIDYSSYRTSDANGYTKDEEGNDLMKIQKRVIDITLTLERNDREYSRTVKASLRNSSVDTDHNTELTIDIQRS